ncbi:hypothetical protein EZH22_16835 [Xanthobacter dioxanivorans]|uniref:Uncharacterized protein n=1 Tax=Xanthobacter dioxanivorans TaxID=2528964 RepID=A0A974PJL8_9HYPH|nr:hypothetical protein [Xanthobacter dioxanivorans]QRG04817.1 hypothetical protein EZH22_16835 [Xanthobacter dioxanivorans]
MSQFGWPALLSLIVVAGMLAPAHALAPGDLAWPDTPEARRAAQAAIEALNAELLAQPSATATLERWCGAHGIAARGEVRAERVRSAEGPAPQEVRDLLGAGPDTPIRHRRVQLRCGATILSEADNFYLPERLTAEMNATLDGTDTPFGKVVRPLDFRRRTLEARLLWTPAEGAPPAAAPGAVLAMPPLVLAHRAVLTLPDGTPFSALIERYTSGVLSFPPPR